MYNILGWALISLAITAIGLGLRSILISISEMKMEFPIISLIPVFNIFYVMLSLWALFMWKPKELYRVIHEKYICIASSNGMVGYIKFKGCRGKVRVTQQAISYITNLNELDIKLKMFSLFVELSSNNLLNKESIIEVKENKLILNSERVLA